MRYWIVWVPRALLAGSWAAEPAQAVLFVSTGQTGAQVQVDVDHTQYWTFTIGSPVNDVEGGLFTMKRGPDTTDNIEFLIFQGVFADLNTATPLLSVTLTPASFAQQFNPVLFQAPGINLAANTTYTGVLRSSAPDVQVDAYFIKGGSNASLSFVDENGDPVTSVPGPTPLPPDPSQVAASPEPATAGLGLISLMALSLSTLRRRTA